MPCIGFRQAIWEQRKGDDERKSDRDKEGSFSSEQIASQKI